MELIIPSDIFKNAANFYQTIREQNLAPLMKEAAAIRDVGHGNLISYSRKVFIPLTQLCRDVCHYCTFAKTPRRLKNAYLTPEEVLSIAHAGEEAGCHEALFTLGDKPELRYQVAKEELAYYGYETTLSYLEAMCELVLRETSLLPHVNPGVISLDEIKKLRACSISQGIMLENVSKRLTERGYAHFGSPDKDPFIRLKTLRDAGIAQVPFTTGILIGIGETREERIASLFAIKALHEEFGHIQEVIIQNFRAKPLTKMAKAPEPDLEDLLWTIAVARLIFGTTMNIQAPPNLTPEAYPILINAGLNDWGGISPVTLDHVNPEAQWPAITQLTNLTAKAGKILVQRLASYPRYCQAVQHWHNPKIATRILHLIDGCGFVRENSWSPGIKMRIPDFSLTLPLIQKKINNLKNRLEKNIAFSEKEIIELFNARGKDFEAVCHVADELRREVCGDIVRYVVNRNINYTNICYFKCQFCAFSKGKMSENLRGKPYDLSLDEIVRRAMEGWDRGATEICLQGGIHPDYTGATYIAICKKIKEALPNIHIHAFSPLEVWQGAKTLKLSLSEFLQQLRAAGLATLPGTAAEILDDEIRSTLCPDKIKTNEWLEVMQTAHKVGFKTTATIMFGHIESYQHWARHLLRLRHLQAQTGGFTEFVPLPFVHMEAPMYLKGKSRKGPTFREAILMHAVARLVLYPLITNIQVSWVKMGELGVEVCLKAGANDLGGTLMNESISRAAGTEHGQEMPPEAMEALIQKVNRIPKQRTTLYKTVSPERTALSYGRAPML